VTERFALDEVEAEMCAQSLGEFVAAAWPVIEQGTSYVPNWHIEAILEHLEAVSRGEIQRLIINIPPRHMKSLAVAVFWPAWVWLTSPHTRFLYASYSQQLSNRDSRRCRQLIESRGTRSRRDGESEGTLLERVGYRGLLALLEHEPWRLAGDQNAKQRFENTQSGYRIATSVGGTATGDGGDVIVIDDPHKADEAESDTVRESVIDWHDGTMATRLNDPKRGARVLIMQRLHHRDLTGHLLAQGGWEHLCLPAEYEPNHPFAWPDDPRTEEGEPLWPSHVPVPELERLKRSLGSYRAAGQLQQRPAPAEGGILKRRWWRFFDPQTEALPHFTTIAQSWDTSFADTEDSSYVVGQLWGCFGAQRYLLRQLRGRMDFIQTLRAIEELSEWGQRNHSEQASRPIYIEDKANGPAIVSALQSRFSGVIPVNPEGDKVARAHAVAPLVEAGNVYLPGAANADRSDCDHTVTPQWVQGLIDECANFPRRDHDDQVDALSQALRRLDGQGESVRPRGGTGTMTGGLADAML
jgi:predicted phage terminase large subunit-like protein